MVDVSNDDEELGLMIEGPRVAWIVRDQPVLAVWHADGDGDTKRMLGCLSRDSQPFFRLWIGTRIVHQPDKEQPSEEKQLLITLHLRIRLQIKSKPREMFLVVPAEMLRFGNDDSTFSAVLGPQATKALTDSALPTTMRIRFSLSDKEASKVFMPARKYPHAVSGTPLDLLMALKSLSEARKFHIDVNLNSIQLRNLSKLQKEIGKHVFKTPSVPMNSMYQNHGAGVNNWADQGMLDDSTPTSKMPSGARRGRKRKHGQAPGQEVCVAPPPYRQIRQVPGVSSTVVIPESSPEPAIRTESIAHMRLDESDNCIRETPNPEVRVQQALPDICEAKFTRELQVHHSQSLSPVTCALPKALPEPPHLHGEIVYWLLKALRACPTVHYSMIPELLQLCGAARAGSADPFWELRATCTARLSYELVGTLMERVSRKTLISRAISRQEAIELFRHEHLMLARWMNIVYPGADLEMCTQLEDSARRAKAFLGLGEVVDVEQYSELEEAFITHKATCIAITAAVYGDQALDPKKEVMSKMMAAKLQFQARPASVSLEAWRCHNNMLSLI